MSKYFVPGKAALDVRAMCRLNKITWLHTKKGFPWWLSNKESAWQCRRHRFDPCVGKIPWRRKWQPTPIFLPEKFSGQRSLVGYSLWDHKELDMTDWAHTNTHTHPEREKHWQMHTHIPFQLSFKLCHQKTTYSAFMPVELTASVSLPTEICLVRAALHTRHSITGA